MRTSLEVRRGNQLMFRKLGLAVLAFVVMIGLPCMGLAASVTLTPSVASPQKLGTPVTWTATVQSAPTGHMYDYQFSVTFNGQSQIVRDFSPTATFPWVPHTVEGAYQVSVVVRDITAAPFVLFAPVSASFTLQPWVTAPLAAGAVNPTTHPLVALFSGPPCTTGHWLIVRFHAASSQTSMTTNSIACSPQSANFLVAGMYPSTQYLMHWEEYDGAGLVSTGADLPFTTGAIPHIAIPKFQVNVPATAHDAAYPVVLWQLFSLPSATDLAGNVIWYSPGPSVVRMEAGGLFYSYGAANGAFDGNTLTQYDLAGNAIRQTNVGIINEQLAAKGYQPIGSFNGHEARTLSNGNILALGSTDRISTTAQGGTPAKPVDILGDMVLVLDHNLQLVWVWDSFARQDIYRTAPLNDSCMQGGGGCPAFNPSFTHANDWLHTNSAQETADGNIILSERAQDWVIKINYANGTGNGDVLWRMGADGDFTIVNPPSQTCGSPNNVFPWFTHQHDAAFQFEENASDGPGTIMTVFDDGNTRFMECPAPQDSRGMVLFVNEAARQVYIETAADLGGFSGALGSGQLLAPGDGNLYASYDNGILSTGAQSTEVNLAGQIVSELQTNGASYRSYRMANLYTPTLPFTATGVYPVTSALQFGSIFVGATEVLPLTVSNFGLAGTATVGTSVNGSSYNVLTTAQNTCQAGIAAGQSCILPVEFDPVSIGTYDNALTLEASGSSSPSPTVALDGIAAGLATTTTLKSSLNPSLLGQPVTFTATVTPTSGPVPTGTVNFEHLGAVLATEPLSSTGVASFTTSTLPANVADHIVAVYSGSTTDAGSTSATLAQAVTGHPTTTTLTSSVNPSALGQPVTFTATVKFTGAVPTGTIVAFEHLGAVLATETINSSGVASFTTSTLPLSDPLYHVVAVYTGSPTDAGSTSGAVAQTIH